MHIKKISSEQEKIIVITLTVILVFLSLGVFIYLPSQNTVKRINDELVQLDSQIRKIETIIGKAKTIDEGLGVLKEEYQGLNKFPPEEEESLRLLSDYARKVHLEITFIKSQPKILVSEIGQEEAGFGKKICQSIMVSIEARSSYKSLLKYLQAIKNTLPAFTSVERLKINKNNSRGKNLNIILDLKLYLLS